MTTKITIYLIAIMLVGCGMFKKKNADPEVLADSGDVSEETSNAVDVASESEELISDEPAFEQDFEIVQDVKLDDKDKFSNSLIEDLENLSNVEPEMMASDASELEDKISAYTSIINDLQDEIIKLNSELDFTNKELYNLKAKSQIWENPFSIYNKEIILNNGSTVYGKITYQDKKVLKVETLIGALTIDRKTIVRIIENVPQAQDTTSTEGANFSTVDIIEIKKDEDGTIVKPSTKKLANLILLGDILEEVDKRGNRILIGDIKNIGQGRADFAKINFIFRMNWQGKTKALTAFVKGSEKVFSDSNIQSDSSIEPDAIGEFELIIPPDFGTFIGYSYSLDWEQYND